MASSTNVVRLPVRRGIFANLSTHPTVLTPNGDGRNDRLQIRFALLNVLEHRPLHMRLFDLSGNLLRDVATESIAGEQALSWDGRDDSGRLLPPGTYVLQLVLKGDAREEVAHRIVSVAY